MKYCEGPAGQRLAGLSHAWKAVAILEQLQIYNEDCLDGMNRIPAGTVDLVLCDLPYGTTHCRWDTVIPFEPLWTQYNRVVKPKGALVFMVAQPFATDLINSARKLFRYDLVWEKTAPTGFANAHHMPMRSHELILLFSRHQSTYNPQGLVKLEKPREKNSINKGGSVYHGMHKMYFQQYTNYPRSVLRFSFKGPRLHPTQKPVELFEYLIRTYSNPGDLVLDNCMGSGTTAIGCLNSGRRFIGFESDEVYFEAAKKRIEAKAASLSGGLT